MIGVWVADMGTERDADKQIVQILDQQTRIWSAHLYSYLRILIVRIVCKKLRRQTINFCYIFHRSTLRYKEKAGRAIPSPPDGFFRSIFILPLSQNRHSTSSLGQFLFYRRVRTVTRLMQETILATIIIAFGRKYVNMNFHMIIHVDKQPFPHFFPPISGNTSEKVVCFCATI